MLSTTRPLAASQVDEINKFMNGFPVSSIGESGTWMDLLFPILSLFDGLTYDASQLHNVLQDPTLCA